MIDTSEFCSTPPELTDSLLGASHPVSLDVILFQALRAFPVSPELQLIPKGSNYNNLQRSWGIPAKLEDTSEAGGCQRSWGIPAKLGDQEDVIIEDNHQPREGLNHTRNLRKSFLKKSFDIKHNIRSTFFIKLLCLYLQTMETQIADI